MDRLLFGTAGVPHSSPANSTVDGIKRIKELGLGCMEIEFVRRVSMGEDSAHLVAATAAEEEIKLSVHAPYYINLNAHEPEKIKASQVRILKAARIGSICGAQSVVFHPAFYLGDPPQVAYETVKAHLAEVVAQLAEEGISICIRPEVMGKPSQFGSLEEIISLSTEIESVAPCIDFSHWHARNGKYNTFPEFMSVLSLVESRLGRAALENMHIHISGIAYGKKGEIKHLTLAESDLQYRDLIKALKEYQVSGLVICESPNLEEDALLLQETYLDLA